MLFLCRIWDSLLPHIGMCCSDLRDRRIKESVGSDSDSLKTMFDITII